MDRKGQAAMEMLMSYGWAIMGVLAGLFAIGFIATSNPLDYVAEKCIGPTGLICEDFEVRPDTITLLIRNSLDKEVRITDLSIPECSTHESGIIAEGSIAKFILTNCTFSADNKIKTRFNITYEKKEIDLSKTRYGEIVAQVAKR